VTVRVSRSYLELTAIRLASRIESGLDTYSFAVLLGRVPEDMRTPKRAFNGF